LRRMDHQEPRLGKEVHTLRNAYGPELVLVDEDGGGETVYRIVHEVEVDGEHYAVLQEAGNREEDAYLFRVGHERVEPVEDDAEWEKVAEAIDELLYFDEQ
jgi:uncharacterized protein YrzB (UPF0473 family)